VGLAYSLKVLWAPLVDRVDAPLLGRLGRRRSWIVLSQIVVAIALIGMAATGPKVGLTILGAFALLTAFASATQDIVVDAWRIEAAADADELGLLSASYQFGYRLAVLVSACSVSMAQSMPNYGPNPPPNTDSFGQVPSGAKPPGVSRNGHRAYAYVPNQHRRHYRYWHHRHWY